MFTLCSIALLIKCGMKYEIYQKDFLIECSGESGFRITHLLIQSSSYHVINTFENIIISYNQKRIAMTYQQQDNNIYSFRPTFTEWLESVNQQKNKQSKEDINDTTLVHIA